MSAQGGHGRRPQGNQPCRHLDLGAAEESQQGHSVTGGCRAGRTSGEGRGAAFMGLKEVMEKQGVRSGRPERGL